MKAKVINLIKKLKLKFSYNLFVHLIPSLKNTDSSN